MNNHGEYRMDKVEWPEVEKPGWGEKIVSAFFILVVLFAAVYFMAHLLVANGVLCG